MNPTVVAAMISSGTKIAVSIFEKWSGMSSNQKTREFLVEHYDTLRGLASDNCMRVLKRLEDGQNRSTEQLLKLLYPDFASFNEGERARLQSEFDYRIFFLALAGVVTRPT